MFREDGCLWNHVSKFVDHKAYIERELGSGQGEDAQKRTDAQKDNMWVKTEKRKEDEVRGTGFP